jgi:hypothetical protein
LRAIIDGREAVLGIPFEGIGNTAQMAIGGVIECGRSRFGTISRMKMLFGLSGTEFKVLLTAFEIAPEFPDFVIQSSSPEMSKLWPTSVHQLRLFSKHQ